MTTPRRRGLGLRACALLALLTACGDGEDTLDPEIRAPNPGTYAYEALIHTEDGTPPDTFRGTLAIAVASEDSIVGTWSVAGFPAEARGIWNINAYTLIAAPAPPVRGTITHRLWRQHASGNLICNATYERVQMPADTFRSSSENDCLLAAQ